MAKKYLEKNVLDAAFERLEIIFEEFDNVYFSVSGGKDSSVMVQLANIVAEKMGKKFDVLFIDLEAQYAKNAITNQGFLSYCVTNGAKKCCFRFTTKMDLLGRRE